MSKFNLIDKTLFICVFVFLAIIKTISVTFATDTIDNNENYQNFIGEIKESKYLRKVIKKVVNDKIIYFQDGHSVSSVIFHPNGESILATAHYSNPILFSVKTGEKLKEFVGRHGWIPKAKFTPDGKILITYDADGNIILWNVKNEKKLKILSISNYNGNNIGASSADFSPDGKTILIGLSNGTAKLWDVKSGKELKIFSINNSEYSDRVEVKFSPNGKSIVAGAMNSNIIKILDVKSGKILQSFNDGLRNEVVRISFSPDGMNILTIRNGDAIAKLWDVKTGNLIKKFVGVGYEDINMFASSAIFSLDGKTIFTAYNNN